MTTKELRKEDGTLTSAGAAAVRGSRRGARNRITHKQLIAAEKRLDEHPQENPLLVLLAIANNTTEKTMNRVAAANAFLRHATTRHFTLDTEPPDTPDRLAGLAKFDQMLSAMIGKRNETTVTVDSIKLLPPISPGSGPRSGPATPQETREPTA